MIRIQDYTWTTTYQSKSCNVYIHTSMVSFKGRSNLKLLWWGFFGKTATHWWLSEPPLKQTKNFFPPNFQSKLALSSPYSQYFPALRGGEIMKLEVFLRRLLLKNQCWSHQTCSKFYNFNFTWFLKYLFWFQNIDSRTIENRFFFQNINLKRRSSFCCVVYEQALGKDQFLPIFFPTKLNNN